MTLNAYSAFLDKANDDQKKRQMLEHPVRQISEHIYVQQVCATDNVEGRYSLLDAAILQLENFEYLYFDEYLYVKEAFATTFQRYDFMNKIGLSVPINLLRYDPGGSMGATVFLWRIPENRGFAEVMNNTLKVVDSIKTKLPEYHTRRMRKEFIHKYCSLHAGKIPKHILRSIYADLTLDSSADQNPTVDERVRQAVLSEDSDLVLDLRHLNKGRPGDTFQQFFDILAAKVEEMSAADERRHNIEHLAKYISIKDLISDVKQVLPDDAPIPSESSVLFSFAPKNAFIGTARLYKSKVPLQFKVQTRQLRLSHVDEHFCAALYKYMRHYAHKFKDNVTFLSIDDKSKVDIGEPGQLVSTGVRGKKSIVPTTSQLSALDHDVSSKSSITPSVCLNVNVPEDMDGSFYQGSVTVAYKDSVFQASSPWRHVAEIQSNLQNQPEVKPILMLFSDGGPDHRLTYHSVKLSLIVLFRNLDLDILIAGRTAPGHSWLNPVERIMSTLNLAFQNAALARSESTADIEQVLKSCNSMSDIRKKSEKVGNLKEKWISSLESVIETLRYRTEKLTLKDIPFKCQDAATDEAVSLVENQIHDVIDANITLGQYQQKNLASKTGELIYLNVRNLYFVYIEQDFKKYKCGVNIYYTGEFILGHIHGHICMKVMTNICICKY